MKYLTDEEIHKWNDRIGSTYRLVAKYNNESGAPDIHIYYKTDYLNTSDSGMSGYNSMNDSLIKPANEVPEIKYIFSFIIQTPL